MRRMGPPGLATWVLEHLAPGERDDALAGDLLEDFHSGRSDAWYWRQVVAAVVVAWYRDFRERAPLLLFAFLWSMLAPAWTVLLDGLQNNERIFGPLGGMDWPFSALSRFVLWMGLNLIFLWGGMLVYCVSLTRILKVAYRQKLRRALLLAPSIFLPIYVATLILMNLFAWPGLEIDRRSVSALGEIIDLGMWANVLRVPYIVTILGALWRVAPRLPRFSSPLATLTQAEHGNGIEAAAVVRELDPFTCGRFFAFMVGAGLVNAMTAGVLLCRLPDSHSPTIAALFIRALIYVAIGGVAGAAGAWFYWQSPASPFRTDPPVPFPEFATVCAAGWVWVPAMVIFSEQLSVASSWVAMIGASLVAVGLRNSTAAVFAPAGRPTTHSEEHELFASAFYPSGFEAGGYVIAACVAGAGWAVTTRSYYTAATLLGAVGFLFAWKKTMPRAQDLRPRREFRRAIRRLVWAAMPAVFITAWALLEGVAHRNRDALQAARENGAEAQRHSGTPNRDQAKSAPGGFESVILWPFTPKKQMIPPVPAPRNYLGLEKSRPLVIRFDGVYWYFQPPESEPGRTAHQAHGTPLGVNIQSVNSFPLTMEAHQRLIGPVRLARCAEIDVEIVNRDNHEGAVSLALLLKDSEFPNKPGVYLGKKEIETTLPGLLTYKPAPSVETLRFAIPGGAPLRNFDDITVLLLPEIEHSMVAPKIAIEQFELFPR